MESQNRKILAHLKKGRTLTPLDALSRFGCLRLGARVYDLRTAGHNIKKRSRRIKPGTIVAEYYLPKGEK